MKKIIVILSFSRKKTLLTLFSLVVAASIFTMLYNQSSREFLAVISSSIKNRIVVIDPGHGGGDPGAKRDDGLKEKDIVLQFAKELRSCLEREKAKIIMTRDKDIDLGLINDDPRIHSYQRRGLAQRLRIAYENKGEILISIHVNNFPMESPSGAQTFYNRNSIESHWLATKIQEEILKIQPTNRRKEQAGNYYLVKGSKIPSVIVEVGFLSNPREREMLQSKIFQKQMAQVITKGVIKFFNEPIPENWPNKSTNNS